MLRIQYAIDIEKDIEQSRCPCSIMSGYIRGLFLVIIDSFTVWIFAMNHSSSVDCYEQYEADVYLLINEMYFTISNYISMHIVPAKHHLQKQTILFVDTLKYV